LSAPAVRRWRPRSAPWNSTPGSPSSNRRSPAAPAESIALADLFCRQARRRVAALRRDLYANDDLENYRFARSLLEGRFAWLSDNIVSTWRREKPRG